MSQRNTLQRRYYSLREVAEILGCSRVTIDSMRYSGALPTVRIGNLIRVRASALDALVEEIA